MSICCECIEKLSACCPCQLNVIGYISGWLGIVWRIVVVALLSSTLANVTVYDPSIYKIFLSSCLTYFVASFIINSVFLYGIFKELRYLLLPHITIVALEMVVGVIISSGIIMLCFAINAIAVAIYTICISIFTIGVSFLLWLYNVVLYTDLEYQAMINMGKKGNIALTNVHSLDV